MSYYKMTATLSLTNKLLIFLLINLTWALIMSTHIFFDGENVLIGPFLYGFLIGILTLNELKGQFFKSLILGFLFLIIFIISSFGMLAISKKVFGTDDILPILSTPFSILLMISSVRIFIKIHNTLYLFIILTTAGLIASYSGNCFIKYKEIFIMEILGNVFFLWQALTGLAFIWWIENCKLKITRHNN
jgi:hypothetical protein